MFNIAHRRTVLMLALGLVAGMTVVFGLVPSLILVRRTVGSDLKAGERGSSRGTRRLYQGLVVAEVALACALLVSSALLIRTVGQMTQVPLGVNADSVTLTTVKLNVADSSTAAWQTVGTQHAAILDRLREQPGVNSAGSANFLLGGIGIFPKVVHASGVMSELGVRHVHCHFATHPALAGFLIHRLAGIPYRFPAPGPELHVNRPVPCRKSAEAGALWLSPRPGSTTSVTDGLPSVMV